MDPVVKLPLDDSVLKDIVDKAKTYALLHGRPS